MTGDTRNACGTGLSPLSPLSPLHMGVYEKEYSGDFIGTTGDTSDTGDTSGGQKGEEGCIELNPQACVLTINETIQPDRSRKHHQPTSQSHPARCMLSPHWDSGRSERTPRGFPGPPATHLAHTLQTRFTGMRGNAYFACVSGISPHD